MDSDTFGSTNTDKAFKKSSLFIFFAKFMNSLNYIIEKDEITIEIIEEDYTSVES